MNDHRDYAALDVGSNTIRLLVARVAGGGLQAVLDRSEFVRLGLDVDASGRLRPDREQAGLTAIGDMAAAARQQGVDTIWCVATSAVRDAANGRQFVQRVRDVTGVEVQIISGDQEARLTFLGATLGLDLAGGAIVCDLGGGSAELIAAGSQSLLWAHSLKIGSGRLTDRYVHHDPPTPSEQAAVQQDVRGALHTLPAFPAHEAVFTGGTATHVSYLAHRQGVVVALDVQTLQQVREVLTAHPAAEIARRHDIKLERAQVLPAGVCALQAIAAFYGIGDIVITQRGIREGIIIDHLREAGLWPGSERK